MSAPSVTVSGTSPRRSSSAARRSGAARNRSTTGATTSSPALVAMAACRPGSPPKW
ncbi:hypothetical protein NLX83_02210 [Allokutzneria sp. A3M-2-11 16]|uniref:hypothetical protein n=1 Tax=Allokutzneria sp. A3M-2-11 16 TaxID=2962043 RepID=UPI0020B7A1DE|nr:hypothetical protein [Allokutzneria sp. A3M-2-11 16]MCP3798063.1 hypothetical protein [Allokutzneria sp. A3M-2-11 16]